MAWKQVLTVVLGLGLLVPAGEVDSTAQIPDSIRIEGKEYVLNTNPLDRYLAKLGDAAPRFESPHTANWRGYVATWEIKDGVLYLRSVEGYRTNPQPDDDDETRDGMLRVDGMKELFPSQNDVVADWYTGALIVPDGKVVEYVHMGYGSTYERYIVSIIREGREVQRKSLSEAEFRHFRDVQFWKFKSTEAYRKMFDEIKARRSDGEGTYTMSDEQIDSFIREYSAEEYMAILDN